MAKQIVIPQIILPPKELWKPQPKQARFQERPEKEALYGGAAGGGKSDALLTEALRQVHIPHYRGIIFRATIPQLEALISRSRDIYTRAYPRARYNENKKCWYFPSGATIFFGYMQREADKYNYQGKPYDFIGFDELTHFTLTQYMYLFSRNRPNGPGTRVYIRATANPGGIGHGWVKERFITNAPPFTTTWNLVDVVDPDGKIMKLWTSRVFIPSTVFDNKKLLENDPTYLASLASLPEAEKQALLYGNWNSFGGMVFREWVNDPTHYDDHRWTHVIKPFDIPEHWTIVRGYDHGYSKPFSVGWFAADTKGKLYHILEYYGCVKGQPNTGLQLDPAHVAREVYQCEHNHPLLKGRQIRGIADPAIFDSSTGESIANMMQRFRVYWNPGDHSRIPGKMQYHYRLSFDDTGDCMFQCFNTCQNFIRTIPALVYSETHVEDVDTRQEDHIYDMTRYVFMDRPISRPPARIVEIPKEDPLDLFNGKKYYYPR